MQPNNETPKRPGSNMEGISVGSSDTQQSTPTVQPTPVTPNIGSTGQNQRSKKSKLKLAGIIAGALVLLGGASAGAYYGVYLPNQPENVLKKSVANTLTKKQTTGKGAVKFTDAENTAVVNYSVQQDAEKNVASANIDAAFSGAKLPVEIRSIDKSLFVKVGDLGSLQGLANLYSPGTGDLVSQFSKQVSNQWIEIDESLLKSTFKEDKCNPLSGEAYKFTEKDVDQILAVYDKNEFVVIKNTSNDTVDNRSVTKMELDVSKDKAKAFGKELESVDYFKRVKECDKSNVSESLSGNEEEFKGSYTINVWVDKSKKELVKVALNTTEDQSQVDFDFTFTNEQVDVKKPEGAKPLMQVLGELGPLFSGLLGAGAESGVTNPGDLQNLEGSTSQY